MSPNRATRSAVELASLLKVLARLAAQVQGKLHLIDEIYYSIADYDSQAAYLIGCVLAGWPQCLKDIKWDCEF